MRARDGNFIQIGQEFLEGIEERIMWEETDALVEVDVFQDAVLFADVLVLQPQVSHLEIG